MDKVRKLFDLKKEDIPYLEMLASRRSQYLKNMLEEFIHQLAVSVKNEEFIKNVEEFKNKK